MTDMDFKVENKLWKAAEMTLFLISSSFPWPYLPTKESICPSSVMELAESQKHLRLSLELVLFICFRIASVFFVPILFRVAFKKKASLGEAMHVLPILGQWRPSHWTCRPALPLTAPVSSCALIPAFGKWN